MWIPTVRDIEHRDATARGDVNTLEHPFYVVRREFGDTVQYLATDEDKEDGFLKWTSNLMDACYFATPATVLTLVQAAHKMTENMRHSLNQPQGIDIVRVRLKRDPHFETEAIDESEG